MTRRWVVLFLFAAMPLAAQFVTGINGRDLPPNVLVPSWDDGPAFAPLFGQSETLLIGASLTQLGAVGLFCQPMCRFAPELATPDSICTMHVQQPFSIDATLLAGGHGICNHTVNHPTLTAVETDVGAPVQIGDVTVALNRVLAEVAGAQALIDENSLQPDGVLTARAPGLGTDGTVVGMLNAFSYTAQLTGFLGMDSQGAGYSYGGTQLGGDTDWYAHGLAAEDFADFMAEEIQSNCAGFSGCLLLNHDSQDNDVWAFTAHRRILIDLGLDKSGSTFALDDITAIPGILGNTRLADPKPLSPEFGSNDGIGAVVLGDVDGDGIADVCKARIAAGSPAQIFCAITGTEGGNPMLAPATAWLTVADGAWVATGYRFWLANITGSKRADLVYAMPAADSRAVSIFVAASNGQGFDPPEKWLAITVPQGGDPLALIQGIRFGNFFRSAGPQDLFFAVPGTYFVAMNFAGSFGKGFAYPTAWDPAAPQTVDPQTFAAKDLNGDGFDDIIARDPVNGQFLVSLTIPGANRQSLSMGFQPATSWLTFAGQTNRNAWNDGTNGATVSVVRIGQPILVGASPAGTGIVYTRIVSGDNGSLSFLPGWRHLCNTCATTDALAASGWHPERRLYGIAWGKLDQSGNDSAVFMRSNGLEVSLGQSQ